MTRKQSKQARLDVGSPAETSPHILRASSYYQRSIHRRNRAQRRGTATVEAGRRNETVAAVRDYSLALSRRKQPGRRYGPAPKKAPHPQMSAPAPLDSLSGLLNYEGQSDGPITARQDRQFRRMKAREVYGRKAENRARRGSVTA